MKDLPEKLQLSKEIFYIIFVPFLIFVSLFIYKFNLFYINPHISTSFYLDFQIYQLLYVYFFSFSFS